MDNNALIAVFMLIQLMGIQFYFSNIERAKTKFQKGKIILMSAYPTLVAISLIFRPLE